MWLIVLTSACLVDTELYEARKAALSDQDGDGWTVAQGDCDDTEASAHPEAEELPWDGVDNDCTGGDLVDVDGDGYDAAQVGGPDCNDEDPAIHPNAEETWSNGITDNDCDGDREAISATFGEEAITGTVDEGQFGRRVATLGDVNGDGIAEFLVGAVYEDGEALGGGAVYLVNGVAGTTADDFPRLYTLKEYAYMGIVAGGADLDGDTIPDLVTTAANTDDGRGTAWLVSGADFAQLDNSQVEEVALFELTGDAPGTYFGGIAAFLGDLDGDGTEELGISASTAPGEFDWAGSVGIWHTSELADGTLADAHWLLEGDAEGRSLGSRLQEAGDLDNDGYNDFLVGGVGVLGAILPGGVSAPELDEPLFELIAETEGVRCDVEMLGDVDGDGERDLGCVQDEAFLIFTTLLGTPRRTTDLPSATFGTGTGSNTFDMKDLGDLDGDGRAETLLPVKWHEPSKTSIVTILPGESTQFGTSQNVLDLPFRTTSTRPLAGYGYRSIVTPDTDGDGFHDIVVATAGDSEGGPNAGGVILIDVPR